MEMTHDHHLFPLVKEPPSRWERPGLDPRHERTFNTVATLLVLLFVAGWTYSIIRTSQGGMVLRQPVATISGALTSNPLDADGPPTTAYLTDELVSAYAGDFDALRGHSGEVKLVVTPAGQTPQVPQPSRPLPTGAAVELQPTRGTDGQAVPAGQAPPEPGIWNLVLRMRDAVKPVADLYYATEVPLSEKHGGRVGGYMVGSWPFEAGGAPKPVYTPPHGLIEVTRENLGTPISEHFTLGDYITKGQNDVWPKYVVISPRVLDKVELTIQEMEAEGHRVKHVFVVSAFRTPNYNVSGGDPSGRAGLSRHMYGDAMDVVIDNDGDNLMDDLNGDGRVDVRDARVLGHAAEMVEEKYPDLVGGIGIYAPTGAHHGFVHIDTRGFRARW
ncbi:MAG: hypothetical protein JWM27_4013 [Gemmatimonadetes bacterium]|nr:hypothetical protein [Gemmatimonadota bacterium]